MNAKTERLLGSLVDAELSYARAYAEHLAVGEAKPAEPAGVDPKLCADIRRALHGEWSTRLQGSPALSGRLRIERRTQKQ